MSDVHTDFFDTIKGVRYERKGISVNFILLNEYREQLISLTEKDLHEVIQRASVFWNGQKIFEAFDGFVIGTLSKSIISWEHLCKHIWDKIFYILPINGNLPIDL